MSAEDSRRMVFMHDQRQIDEAVRNRYRKGVNPAKRLELLAKISTGEIDAGPITYHAPIDSSLRPNVAMTPLLNGHKRDWTPPRSLS